MAESVAPTRAWRAVSVRSGFPCPGQVSGLV